MRYKCPEEKVVSRGAYRLLNDERELARTAAPAAAPRRAGLRLQGCMIAVLLFLLCVSFLAINSYSSGQYPGRQFGSTDNSSGEESDEKEKAYFAPAITSGYLVRNKGCRIPALDPFDPMTKLFVRKEDPLVCDHGSHLPLVDSNLTSIFLNEDARHHFYKKGEKVDCCWRDFWRSPHQEYAVTFRDECIPFNGSERLSAEFVKVECRRKNETVYKDYHAFVPRKSAVEERCREAYAAARGTEEHLSLLILGLDSVSRLNFHRMMPKTVKALQKIGAVEMLGYTKVADNTYPNLVPVLTGLSAEELTPVCWQNKKKTFDACPFIWKNFSAAGYRTIFGEDACDMTTFNYMKPGFRDEPTDYYLRPFSVASERDIGNTWKLNANLCIGTRKTHENLLAYARKAASQFAYDPYFALIWQAGLTHDFLNYPQFGDHSYQELVLHLWREGFLNKTALIVMSDHGMRFGEFRQTYQGRVEDSLPFVFLVLPQWWRDKHQVAWANLRRNSRSLTTPFDLHETMLDLLDPRMLREASLRRRTGEPTSRGISWFLPIPDDRTCTSADILSNWCMCHASSDIALDDPGLEESANYLVSELNKMLQKYAQCAVLSLKEIKHAKAWMEKSQSSSLMDYTVTLVTEPGDAVFEGTIRYRTDDRTKQLVGSVSRLNAYGKQSACVGEFNMRLYCYCL